MSKQKAEDLVQVKIRSKDQKRLNSFKIHPNQRYWEIVKLAVDALEEARRK